MNRPTLNTSKAPAPRRRVLAAGAALPLLGLGLGLALAPPRAARAAAERTPATLRALDTAAMALFDAAEGAHWAAARRALDQAQASGATVATLEPDFLSAGGELWHFFEAHNNLSADLVEARIALSVKDKRWLVSCADRIAARAGELSQPFAAHADALLPRVESLLFLARRMRSALVWGDTFGLDGARVDFRRLWLPLRLALKGHQPAHRLQAIDDALARTAESRSASDVKALYGAVQALRDGLG